MESDQQADRFKFFRISARSLSERLKRAVHRLLHGERDDPI
jgi:hypothetical protein